MESSSSPLPEILSMDTSPRSDSFLRIRCGERVKYVVVSPGTLNSDELCLPLYSLPPLPYNQDGWTVARVSRSAGKEEPEFSLDSRPLRRVSEARHSEKVDCLSLERVKQLTVAAFECVRKGQFRLLQQTDITPRFLGHIHEEGRVIGFLLEKLDGVSAGIEHRSRCAEILGRVHQMGLLHGDVNRYNFIIGEGWTKMIDFEHCQEMQDRKLMESEILSLPSQLQDESGRGAGFLTDDEEED